MLSLLLFLLVAASLFSPAFSLQETTGDVPNDPSFSQQWNLATIRAPLGWRMVTSSSVVVAIVDSGVDFTHPDLAPNAWENPQPSFGCDTHGYNFAQSTCDTTPDDDHGTRLAGIVGAVGNNSEGITGIAWHIRIMDLKVIVRGSVDVNAAAQAIRYAADNRAKIINISWGVPFSQALFDSFAYAESQGVIITASAGNSGSDNDVTTHYPSNFDLNFSNVVTLANSDESDNLRSTSNYGSNTVQMAAPGTDILSTCRTTCGYSIATGTSDSAPHFAAAAALVWSRFPALTYSQVIARVLAGGDRLPSLSGLVSCECRLDLAGALAVPTPQACAGDFDENVKVNIFDLAILALHYNSTAGQPLYGSQYDLNSDGKISILDVSIFAKGYGQTC